MTGAPLDKQKRVRSTGGTRTMVDVVNTRADSVCEGDHLFFDNRYWEVMSARRIGTWVNITLKSRTGIQKILSKRIGQSVPVSSDHARSSAQ